MDPDDKLLAFFGLLAAAATAGWLFFKWLTREIRVSPGSWNSDTTGENDVGNGHGPGGARDGD